MVAVRDIEPDIYADFWRKLERLVTRRHREKLELIRAEKEQLGDELPKPNKFWTRTCLGPSCARTFRAASPYNRLCENCVKTVRDAPYAASW